MEDSGAIADIGKNLKKGAFWGIITGVVILIALIVFVTTHQEEAEEIVAIIKRTDLLWLGLAILAEILTYLLAGMVWYSVAKSAQYHLSLKALAMLAVEQLSINQLIPAGGIAGNVIIVKAMRRLGLPNVLAMEVLFIDLLSYYIAFSSVTFIALITLLFDDDITPIILTLVGVFFIIEISITMIIWTVANHQKLNIPQWVKNRKLVMRILNSIENISPQRIFSAHLLAKTGLLRFGIFLLDASTLFLVIHALGEPASFLTTFVALVIASVAGAVTLLPGGIGGFEVGCIAVLIILGTPGGVAVAGTLLFRGLSLWIPLIPGLIIARKDLGFSKKMLRG